MTISKLLISADGHHIVQSDGQPFLYFADTAWGLFHKLNREDALLYLDDRAAKEFNVIQAVLLSEADGIRTPNAYGRRPLRQNASGEWDATLPDLGGEYDYWQHVRFILDAALERGLYVAVLPCWGDKWNKGQWGAGPEVFEPDSAYTYGKWLGEQFKDTPNIIWVVGGDRQLETRRHFEIVCGMARGLRDGDLGAHLIGFHPYGGCSSAPALHDEPWLDFNMIQSGHVRGVRNDQMILKDYARIPAKPVVDAEPGYEHHPESFNPANGYLDEADVRQQTYRALFSGACGHAYGDHAIWGFREDPFDQPEFPRGHFCMSWRDALNAAGACQMRHAKRLMLSRPILTTVPAPELIVDPQSGALSIPVLCGDGFLFAYTAQGYPIQLKPSALPAHRVHAQWFDPRTGTSQHLGAFDSSHELTFRTPSGGRGQDWILILDAS